MIQTKIKHQIIFAREKGMSNKGRLYRDILRSMTSSDSLGRLRGLEGAANKRHFEIMRELVPQWVSFTKRVHRNPADPMNIMLSYLYTVLYQFTCANLTLTGLDPWLGFYHDIKTGHRACASDVMEPFRVIVVDRVIISLLRRRQITPSAFHFKTGRCHLTKEGYDILLTGFHARMARQRCYNGESLTWMEILRRECFALSAAVRRRQFYEPLQAIE